jgi:hypothetical protein
LCVVAASVVQDEEAVEWSEVSALVWPIQPRLWFTLRCQLRMQVGRARLTQLLTHETQYD